MAGVDFTLPKGAIFSDDRRYRYALWRVWGADVRPLLMIGFNPSTANEISEDATITRMVHRAAIFGFTALLVGNLYAYVSTNPDTLLDQKRNSVGTENDAYLEQMIGLANQTLCGWGSFSPVRQRAAAVLKMIPQPYCLGINRNGFPRHPLYVPYDQPFLEYKWPSTPPKS